MEIRIFLETRSMQLRTQTFSISFEFYLLIIVSLMHRPDEIQKAADKAAEVKRAVVDRVKGDRGK